MELLLGLTFAFLRGLKILGIQLLIVIAVIMGLCAIGYCMYLHPIITVVVATITFVIIVGLNEDDQL